MSDEITLLEKACAQSSQAAVARKLGYSPAVVNLVLKGTYTGDLNKVKRIIKVRLGTSHIECPVLGKISTDECTKEQGKPFSASNSHRVRLFKACRSCPFNTKRKGLS